MPIHKIWNVRRKLICPASIRRHLLNWLHVRRLCTEVSVVDRPFQLSTYTSKRWEELYTSGWLLWNLLLSLLVCLFVLWFFVRLENLSCRRRCHHCRWKATHFDLCLALMVIKQCVHTYYDNVFIMAILKDPWHLHLLPSDRSVILFIYFYFFCLLYHIFETRNSYSIHLRNKNL